MRPPRETERLHPKASLLIQKSDAHFVQALIEDQQYAVSAASNAAEEIAAAAELVVTALRHGGRLFYIGAGTSGRLAALDAAELKPTFGVKNHQVIVCVAGGKRALTRAIEGAEDSRAQAIADLKKHTLCSEDVVVGISASGNTPYVLEALKYSKSLGCKTVLVTCNKSPAIAAVIIELFTGPELVAGSTRLKAGTATKIALNALSTTVFRSMGRIYQGRMVGMKATNQKLHQRALKMINDLTGLEGTTAKRLLEDAGGVPGIALLMHRRKMNLRSARTEFERYGLSRL